MKNWEKAGGIKNWGKACMFSFLLTLSSFFLFQFSNSEYRITMLAIMKDNVVDKGFVAEGFPLL